MHIKSLSLALAVAVCSATISGCAGLRPAEPIAADEHYVCRAGSGLKYREPRAQSWPDFLMPRPPAGSCLHR